MPSVEDHFQVNNQDIPDDHNSNYNTILVSEYYPPLPAPPSLPPSLEIELRNKIADIEKKIDTLRVSESIPPPSLPIPSLPSSREKETSDQINHLDNKIEKIGKIVIDTVKELGESLNNSNKIALDSLNKAETVLRLEGIKAGLATATPQDQKQMLGERLFPLIQRIYPDRAGKITGMMLGKDNNDMLRMFEDPEFLSKEAKAAFDLLISHEKFLKSKSVKSV